jgi:amino acid transporter
MNQKKSGHSFGTAPVFLAAISTILGAILFLRFGYAVANAGLLGALLLILIGHCITIPTALAIAEIATNLKVEGGGEYFIISRSFGSVIGGTIGISLYLSQAISVAFYMIAFSEAFTPLFDWFYKISGIVPGTWMIGLPATLILLVLILRKGAAMGVTVLWIVVSTLGISLVMFFLGNSPGPAHSLDLLSRVQNPDNFFMVFAIIFPAFTGMTAGVGLSGDLKNARRSIPLGTLTATVTGMIVYFLVVLKLSSSLSPAELAADQLSMSKIALWGPIIPIGLAAATLSSAIGSILIAPRTLQALAGDNTFPLKSLNQFLSRGKGKNNEPFNATLLTSLIVIIFVSIGGVDFVAQIISMFFMITYGSLCLVSFLEHFAGNPSYRPTFRTKWYLSLIGALACFIMMFQMSPVYALLSLLTITIIYLSLKRSKGGVEDISTMVRGVLYQLIRKLQVLIQKKQTDSHAAMWRPSFIALSAASLQRLAPFDFLRWISHYYGFGTFIHFIKGPLNENSQKEAGQKLDQMINQVTASNAGIYVDTIISPSFKTAVAQIVQIPGIAGMDNNSILFEFSMDNPEHLTEIIDGCQFASIVDYNIAVLRSSERHFGYKKKIDIWLTPGDYRNANLMILLAFILNGHPEWRKSQIEIFAVFEEKEIEIQIKKLNQLIDRGRIPISKKNVNSIPFDIDKTTFDSLVSSHSDTTDLVILGFSLKKIIKENGAFFKKFENIKDILFVRAGQKIAITDLGE